MKLKIKNRVSSDNTVEKIAEPIAAPETQPEKRSRANTLDKIATDSLLAPQAYVLKSRAPVGE